MTKYSIVDYMGEQNGHNCGYCGVPRSSISHGMWAHCLTAQDYQDLIDRGWRRSGQYCYKPKMQTTCCPSYTIRCEALNFKMTKSQKKVAKVMHNFLAFDKRRSSSSASGEDMGEQISDACQIPVQEFSAVMDVENDACPQSSDVVPAAASDLPDDDTSKCVMEASNDEVNDATDSKPASAAQENAHCSSYDPSRAPSKKAKDIRRERRMKKLLASGISPEDIAAQSTRNCPEKSLEEFLNLAQTENAAHKLELRLVLCLLGSPQFEETFEESYSIYKKYQMAIHNDTAEECSREQYKRFLVKTPYFSGDTSAPLTYAPFHHQYVLDGKIVAVGVLDVLPYCVSSVYFYYDPDYSFLSLGRYSALTEIALARKLNKKFPLLKYYYMGFYIHSCPKMTYKGNYCPSYLLCPETYIFQPIEKCKPKLDVSKYQRLEDDLEKEDVDGVVHLEELKILYMSQYMSYSRYKYAVKHSHDDEILRQYGAFVGRKCYKRMYIYMS